MLPFFHYCQSKDALEIVVQHPDKHLWKGCYFQNCRLKTYNLTHKELPFKSLLEKQYLLPAQMHLYTINHESIEKNLFKETLALYVTYKFIRFSRTFNCNVYDRPNIQH